MCVVIATRAEIDKVKESLVFKAVADQKACGECHDEAGDDTQSENGWP